MKRIMENYDTHLFLQRQKCCTYFTIHNVTRGRKSVRIAVSVTCTRCTRYKGACTLFSLATLVTISIVVMTT